MVVARLEQGLHGELEHGFCDFWSVGSSKRMSLRVFAEPMPVGMLVGQGGARVLQFHGGSGSKSMSVGNQCPLGMFVGQRSCRVWILRFPGGAVVETDARLGSWESMFVGQRPPGSGGAAVSGELVGRKQ